MGLLAPRDSHGVNGGPSGMLMVKGQVVKKRVERWDLESEYGASGEDLVGGVGGERGVGNGSVGGAETSLRRVVARTAVRHGLRGATNPNGQNTLPSHRVNNDDGQNIPGAELGLSSRPKVPRPLHTMHHSTYDDSDNSDDDDDGDDDDDDHTNTNINKTTHINPNPNPIRHMINNRSKPHVSITQPTTLHFPSQHNNNNNNINDKDKDNHNSNNPPVDILERMTSWNCGGYVQARDDPFGLLPMRWMPTARPTGYCCAQR